MSELSPDTSGIPAVQARGADAPQGGQRPRFAAMSRRKGARERILAGALTAMGRRGLHKVSVEDICDAAGLSRRTLYRHFDGREEIIAGIAQHISERFEAELAQAVKDKPRLEDRVRVVVEQLSFYSSAHEDTARLVASEIEFMRDNLALTFDQYIEMIRLTVAPIFAAYPQLARAGLSDRNLAELIVRFAMQILLLPVTAPDNAVEAFCRHWDLTMKGALAAGV